MVKFYDDLEEYLSISKVKKYRSKILASAAMKIDKNFIDEEIIDIRSIDKEWLLKFHKTLPNYLIRKSVWKKIIKAAQKLIKKWIYIEIFELYRSLQKQRKEFEEIKWIMIDKYPLLSQKDIYKKTTEFIADPDVFPPHITWWAVDLRLIEKDWNIIDMGNEINSPDSTSHFYTKWLSISQKNNRRILRKTFLDEWFAPLATEWWHFSYWDNYWAAFYNQKALFNIIDIL